MIPITAGILGGAGSIPALAVAHAAPDCRVRPGFGICRRSSLGLLAGLSGTLFGSVSSSPWALFFMGTLLLVFGLALLDVFTR